MKGKPIKIKDARCQSCDLVAPVTLAAAAGDGKEKDRFQIEVYTGQPVKRFWGTLAIDVDGIQAKDAMPVLKEHNREAIVGYTSKAWKDGSFFVEGIFSQKIQAAQEARDLAEEGFPWQASMGIRPLKIMELESGVETKVNGQTIKGPADIWMESEVLETSFVALGADDHTRVSTFARNFKEPEWLSDDEPPGGQQPTRSNPQQQEGKDMEITLKLLQEKAPELLAQIRDEAKKQARAEGLAQGAADLEGDSQPPVDQAAPPDIELSSEDSPVDSAGNFDKDKATELFNQNPGLKKEFGNDLEAYLAYAEAAAGGYVRELKNKA